MAPTFNSLNNEYVLGSPIEAILEADTDAVNASTTLVEIPEFTIQFNPYDRVIFTAHLNVSSAAAADFKLRVDCPGTAGSYLLRHEAFFDTAATAYATSEADISYTWTTATGGVILLYGNIQNGATDGELQIQFAQNSSNASDTKVLAGSRLVYRKY